MAQHDLTDRIRDLVDGRLSAEEAARVRHLVAEDAEAAAFLEAYAAVHAVTSVVVEDVPECGLEFSDVVPGAGSSRWPLGRVAAAAVLAVAAAGAVVVGWQVITPRVNAVTLQAVSAAARPPETAPEERVPLALADFHPNEDGKLRWFDSLEAGRRAAAATGRPIVLFVYHPTCPVCIDLREETFPDPEVLALLEDFVPVHVNVMEAPAEVRTFTQAGWPYMGALDADGEVLLDFPGYLGPEPFRARLAAALTKAGGRERALPWARVRELAGRLREAVRARDEGRLGDAHEAFGELEAEGGEVGAAARAGLAALAAEAARALSEARRAGKDSATRLDEARKRFAGTPYARDFDAVLDALERSGRFPTLLAGSAGGS